MFLPTYVRRHRCRLLGTMLVFELGDPSSSLSEGKFSVLYTIIPREETLVDPVSSDQWRMIIYYIFSYHSLLLRS